jgi:hypothetical protein
MNTQETILNTDTVKIIKNQNGYVLMQKFISENGDTTNTKNSWVVHRCQGSDLKALVNTLHVAIDCLIGKVWVVGTTTEQNSLALEHKKLFLK